MRSLRGILFVGMAAVVVVTAGGSALLSFHAGMVEAGEEFDARLAESARVLNGLMDESLSASGMRSGSAPLVIHTWDGHAKGVGAALDFPNGHAYEAKLVFQVRAADGTLLMRSESGPEAGLAPLVAGFADEKVGRRTWRSFSMQSPSGRWYQVAERGDIRNEIAEDIGRSTALPTLLALPVLLLLMWFVIRHATRQLQNVANDLEGLAPEHLEPLPISGVPSEVRPLVVALNGLLARLGDVLQRERRFTANAAHELRTPLATLRIHAHNLQHVTTPAENVATQASLREGLRRMERVVEQLLGLSRLEPGMDALKPAPLALAPAAEYQLAELASLAFRREITLSLLADDATIVGDDIAIGMLIRNLTDNALRYTPAGGQVTVRIVNEHDGVTLVVEDSGPGIPIHLRAIVFDRFYRGEDHEEPGSGLGLSIVRLVADLHGATVRVDASVALGGLAMHVTFPHASDPASKVVVS